MHLLGDLVGLDLLQELLGLRIVLKVVAHRLEDEVEALRKSRIQITCTAALDHSH